VYREKTVCAVVPAYNEAKFIGGVLDRMPDYVDTIVVVDDGSRDETPHIARAKGALVVTHNINRGVGAAFHTGVDKALKLNVDIMVTIDADGQFDPKDIDTLIDPISDGSADFVTASRFKDKNLAPTMSRIKYWGNIGMSRLISFLTGQKFYDVSCGFRAYSKEALLRLNLFGQFTYTQETFIDLAFKNLTIREVPLSVEGEREHGHSKVAKNLFRYAYRTSKIILRAFRDYKPLKFFGFISGLIVCVGVLLEASLFWHYFQTGSFSPYKVVGFIGGFLLAIGLLIFVTGLLADMFHRIRVNQEEILYYEKKELFTHIGHGPEGRAKASK
jgi:glycosyltransferase involved in cell wall biosynthesis